ncbi:hypothetical protein BJ165DRAFT_1426434 [Panaeolus papilionaceus]|nr:hypothetical protein BJ165DRAFT_1426434 [Panaeolus papilionaceus]
MAKKLRRHQVRMAVTSDVAICLWACCYGVFTPCMNTVRQPEPLFLLPACTQCVAFGLSSVAQVHRRRVFQKRPKTLARLPADLPFFQVESKRHNRRT